MSNFFDEHYQEYDRWYERNRFAYLSELEAVKKVLPKKGYGLEIGVGSGRFAEPLGINIGIDSSEKMIGLARARGVNARIGSGEELPFDDATFDYVAIIVTLCFVQDPEKVIAEAARVLRPNGKIIVGIIDKESFLGKFYQEKESIFYGYATFFTIKEVVLKLKAAGFKAFSYYQTIFNYLDKIDTVQEPQEGCGQGGFVVIQSG